MKKATGFKRAALPVFSALMAAVVSLTTVTYAWFTSGTTATVAPINVGVEAAGGLQIAMGTENAFEWKSSIDLTEQIGDVELAPVSTSGAENLVNNNRSLVFLTANYSDVYNKISNVTTGTSFISFDLYFRNPEFSQKDVNIMGTTVDSLTGGSYKAVRMAFVAQSDISSADNTATQATFGAAEFTSATHPVKIFEPNVKEHTNNGITDYEANMGDGDDNRAFEYRALVATTANSTDMYDRYTGEKYVAITGDRAYDENATNTNKLVFDSTSKGGVTKFRQWEMADDFTHITAAEANTITEENNFKPENDKTPIYELKEGKYVLVTGAIEPTNENYHLYTPVKLYEKSTDDAILSEDAIETFDTVEADGLTAVNYFRLAAQSVTKVTVYIWLEGQDADCENTIAGFQFNVNLSFNATVVPES